MAAFPPGPPPSPSPSGSIPLLLDPPRHNCLKLGLAGAFWPTARSRSQPGNSFRCSTKGLLGTEGRAGHASSPVGARGQPGRWWSRGRAGVSERWGSGMSAAGTASGSYGFPEHCKQPGAVLWQSAGGGGSRWQFLDVNLLATAGEPLGLRPYHPS